VRTLLSLCIVQPRNTCMTLHDRLVHQTRLFHTTSLLGFHRISCNQSLVICIREAARSETLEVKYRKMMEDNNVEKVCLFRSAFTLRLSTSLGLIKKKLVSLQWFWFLVIEYINWVLAVYVRFDNLWTAFASVSVENIRPWPETCPLFCNRLRQRGMGQSALTTFESVRLIADIGFKSLL